MDFKDLKENLDVWQKNLDKRGASVDLKKIIASHDEYSTLLNEVEILRAKRKDFASKKDIEGGKAIKKELDDKEKKLTQLKGDLDKISNEIPNLLLSDVPDGGEDDGKILATVGKPIKIEKPKDHIELGTSLNILDIERGVKTSGSRFYFLKNEAVELEHALVRWAFDLLKKDGRELLATPMLVNEDVINSASGFLGKNNDEVYKTQDDLYLIATSEQSMLGYHMDEMVDVPKRYAAFSSCFRRESGSHGKDVKGIIRVHQFDKVEMFSYVLPADGDKEFENIIEMQEKILKELEIPYQKVLLAAEDVSACSAKTIDLEGWLPSQDRYREITSASNCTDWQARRANIRYKKGEYLYTLNGTAVSIARLLVLLMENHQQPDGSIKIPKALHPYLSFKEIK